MALLSALRPPGRLSAVCFDMDGVLIDTMPLHARAWQDALRRRGLRVSKRLIYAWEGEPGRVTARRLLSRQGRRVPAGRISELLDDKERLFIRYARGIRCDGRLLALLEELAGRAVKLALVTGTSAKEVERMLPERVRRRFDAVVTADQVRHGKPHPEPYRRALRQLGVLPPQAVVVENAPHGIRSARRARAGLVVALTSSLPRAHLHEAHFVVHSLPRLCALLRRLTAGPVGLTRRDRPDRMAAEQRQGTRAGTGRR